MSFVSNEGGNGGLTGLGSGSPAAPLNAIGSFAGMASQVATLTGAPGAAAIGGASRTLQLAQTGLSLLGKTPASIADSINSLSGARPRLTQTNRFITFESPLGEDVLLISAAVIDEYVNRLPEVHLDLLSHQSDIEPEKLVGQRVKLTLKPSRMNASLTTIVSRSSENDRHFDGYVASFARVGNSGTVTRYEMTVVPWFWFLTRSTDCRIFQNKTAKQILIEIFQELGFHDYEFDLRTAQAPLEYIVMYQESYYNFCARLMEQEGMLWTFRYEKDKHVLVIGDTNSALPKVETLKAVPYYADSAASEREGIDRWDEAFEFRVGKISFRDFNYNQPSSSLMYVQAPTSRLKNPKIETTERYQYHSLYDHHDDGQRYARYAMEAEEAQARRFNGTGFVCAMTTMGRFTLVNHPNTAYDNKEYVALHVRHQAVNDYTRHAAEMPYRNEFTCQPFEVPYRPQRVTPKPYMQGTQAAIVVGPKGEEIYTDGSRVKLHFFWDRRGQYDGSDSMWVRVSQPWAGEGWGGSAIPRIGQEVIVAYNDGDPDNPVIVGRVFNGAAENPYKETSGQTMGIRSKTHRGSGFNELRFSDVNGSEEVFLHAQKDMTTVILDNETHTVDQGNRTVLVNTGDEVKQIGKGSLNESIALARTTTATTVEVNTAAKDGGGGTQVYQAERGIMHAVGASMITLAPEGIRLEHNGSVILIDDSGVMINGKRIDLNK
ncbi:type VI secretion system secreted protein VgrG [Trinickia symbiotica]|uniref:Type VI secretion system tip protein VgrG n=1 Tax=Trinickia symbiotica TaxID=863227 RepID=A0A2N7X110_9BURK|nr:type VI secretion system tip protein VgrG [Trinickia symbiotica]PPK45456.1 type VI secretion system secreted protein VgrG [Trinickia symbiotica]